MTAELGEAKALGGTNFLLKFMRFSSQMVFHALRKASLSLVLLSALSSCTYYEGSTPKKRNNSGNTIFNRTDYQRLQQERQAMRAEVKTEMEGPDAGGSENLVPW